MVNCGLKTLQSRYLTWTILALSSLVSFAEDVLERCIVEHALKCANRIADACFIENSRRQSFFYYRCLEAMLEALVALFSSWKVLASWPAAHADISVSARQLAARIGYLRSCGCALLVHTKSI